MKTWIRGLGCLLVCVGFMVSGIDAQKSEAKSVGQKESAAEAIAVALEGLGIDAARVKFKEMLVGRDTRYSFRESEFLKLGYKLLGSGDVQKAIAAMDMAAQVFPNSHNVFVSLGRAHREAGNHEQDRQSVEHALELQNRGLLAKFLKSQEGEIATTAEEVMERHLEAIGGRERQLGLKTMVIEYTSLDSIDQEVALTRYYKFPHFVRQDNHQSGTGTATDGLKVWSVTPRGWKELSGSAWAYVPDIYNDFVGFEERGISYTLLGIEAVDRAIYYHLLKKYPDGEERDYYFLAGSGLFRIECRDFGMGKDRKSYWDYRRHGGILIPHLFIVTWDVGFGETHGGIIKSIRVNVPLEDSFFRPKEESKR